jgi:hypothetical protein
MLERFRRGRLIEYLNVAAAVTGIVGFVVLVFQLLAPDPKLSLEDIGDMVEKSVKKALTRSDGATITITNYKTKSGITAQVKTRVLPSIEISEPRTVITHVAPYKEVTTPAQYSRNRRKVCRYAETTVEVSGGGEALLEKELYCRTPSGDWEPAPKPQNIPKL